MTGQQEVGLLRLTGQKLHLQPLTETSKPLLSPRPPIRCRQVNCRIKHLVQLEEIEFDGCKRNTWFTTTALTLKGSLKVSHLSANGQVSYRKAKLAYLFIC